MKIAPYYPYRSAEARDRHLAAYDRSARDWPVPCECRMARTAWGDTFARISGPAGAEPLVLLPGLTASSLIWAPNIAALSSRYRTYAVDRAGDIGRSTCTRPMKTPGEMVAWLDQLFTALDLREPINLAGLSYGGWLTAEYALRHPERLRKMVWVAPAATVRRTRLEFLARGLLVLTGRRRLVRSTVAWLLEDLARKDPPRVETSVNRALLTLECVRMRRPVGPRVLTDGELRDLRVPALFLVGEHEKIYSASKAVERLQRVAPEIQTEVIPGAGHDLTLAQPELVNRKILEFLAEG